MPERFEQYQERPGLPFDRRVARLAVRACLEAPRMNLNEPAEQENPELPGTEKRP